MVIEADSESRQVALISLSEFMAGNLPAENDQEKEKINPVGIILYAGRNRMILIGSHTDKGFKRALVCSYIDTPEGFNPDQVSDGKNRIIDLKNYEQLKVSQVSLGGVNINTYPSIHTLPSVNVTIQTQNPINEQEETIHLDEIELLRVFTGESGGIAVFSGADLPEANALLLEKNLDGKKSGLALFMYPDADPISALDSVTGLHVFVNTLNQQFLETPRYPLQAESLAAFERSLRAGELDFGGIDVREELYKTLVIAHVRLAARLKQPQYQEFLKSHLPAFGWPEWARFLRGLLMKIGIKDNGFQSLADQAIDKLILGEQIPEERTLRLPSAYIKETDEEFVSRLKNPKARDIWQIAGSDYKDNYHGRQWVFIVDIVNFIQAAKTPSQVADAVASLQRLQEDSQFKKADVNYEIDTKRHRVRLSGSYSKRNAEELLQYLRIQVTEKQESLESASVPATKDN